MKKINLLLISIFYYGIIYPQTDTTIISMHGFEGNDGNSYLVYQTKQSFFNDDVDSSIFNFYLYNINTKTRRIIDKGWEKIYYPENHLQFRHIENIGFVNNDPQKCIYSVNSLGIDPDSRIIRSDVGEIFGLLGFIEDIFISKSDPNLIYAIYNHQFIKSSDGGLNWSWELASTNIDNSVKYLSFFPYDQSKVLGINSQNHLAKSDDSGKTFIDLNVFVNKENSNTVYFNKDQKHIYLVTNQFESIEKEFSRTYGEFYYSNNEGNNSSWNFIDLPYPDKIVCVDDSSSNNVFIATGNEIYKLNDSGKTFINSWKVPHHPSGMYKKPLKDILFVSVPNGIIKIENDSLTYIVKKSIKKSLDLYPLSVGNKWTYNTSGVYYELVPIYFNISYSEEIIKDTTTESGLHYFCLKDNSTNYTKWLRIDTLTGNIFQKDSLSFDNEYLFTNLISQIGENIEISEGILLNVLESSQYLWNNKNYLKYYYLNTLSTFRMSFVQGLGITERLNSFDFGNSTTTLLGCVINGNLYGDTTVVGINDNLTNIPTDISLSQNYPNPFNPTTNIEYSIPQSFVPNSFQNLNTSKYPKQILDDNIKVSLKVYDVLGKEIKTLVNEIQKPGNYNIQFNGADLPSGVYFYQLKYGIFSQTKKMLILK